MPLTSTIINPRMMAEITTPFLASTCDIYEQSLADPDSYGQVGSPTAVTGLQDIPCTVQRAIFKSIEKRLDTSNPAITMYNVFLDGVYTGITTAMLAVISGVTYNITAVHHASSGSHTQLDVEKVNP